MDRKVNLEELSSHNNAEDAWMAINGIVWNVTGFADIHPGGAGIIQEHFGRDASEVYNDVHSPKLAERNFEVSQRIGALDAVDLKDEPKLADSRNPKLVQTLPDLDTIISLHDLEEAAKQCLNERSWAYISGASNDSLTHMSNAEFYRKIFLRPRVARRVKSADTSVQILDNRYDLPIFNAPASLMMLSHPEAEVALAKGLASNGSSIIIPTLSSFSTEEITEALPKDHPFFFQLYMPPDKTNLERILKVVCKLQPKAIMVTVDLPVFSKREANERYEKKVAKQKISSGSAASDSQKQEQQATSASIAIDPNLCWDDISWLRKRTNIPIFVKGIQCAEDALQAWRAGCEGIYISNHGGRAADTAQPTILTLAEIRLRYPEIVKNMDIFIDGGVRRGSDILKAVCLGAKGVCLGRPFFYALMYGEEGVGHVMQCKSPYVYLSLSNIN